jgi:hypothetical protein
MQVSGQLEVLTTLLAEEKPSTWRLNGPQSRSGRCEAEKNMFPLPRIESSAVQPAASRYTDWAIPEDKVNLFWKKQVCDV